MNQCSNILTHASLDVSEHHTSTCCVLLSHISNSTGVLYISVLWTALSCDCIHSYIALFRKVHFHFHSPQSVRWKRHYFVLHSFTHPILKPQYFNVLFLIRCNFSIYTSLYFTLGRTGESSFTNVFVLLLARLNSTRSLRPERMNSKLVLDVNGSVSSFCYLSFFDSNKYVFRLLYTKWILLGPVLHLFHSLMLSGYDVNIYFSFWQWCYFLYSDAFRRSLPLSLHAL